MINLKNFKLGIILGLILFASTLKAQQRPVYSQYIFNGLVLNPAYAGSQKQLSATGIYRKQWVNIDGAPSTFNATVHSGFEKKNIGLGLMITNDNIGIHNDFGLHFSYAYKIPMEHGTLSMGLQGGFNYLDTDFNKLNLKHGVDQILYGKITDFNPNFGTGLYYSTSNSYVGVSIPYIINNKIYQGGESVSYAKEARNYFVSAGKVFDLNTSVKVKPSLLLRVQEASPLGFDANINFILEEIISLGTSYRSGDSFILLFHIIANENFSFGYAYDWTLSGLNPHTRGSHEIMVNYRIKLTNSPCHTYF